MADFDTGAGTATTLPGIFLDTVARKPDATAALEKGPSGQYRKVTWATLRDQAIPRAAGLVAFGLNTGDRVCILGTPTLDWMLSELAIQMAGGIVVPIYETHPAADVAYVVNDSGAVMAFVHGEEQLEKFRETWETTPTLSRMIRLDAGETSDPWVSPLADLDEAGAAYLGEHPSAVDERMATLDPEQAACFIYTSGTTGPPKGVELTHQNWAFMADVSVRLDIAREDDVGINYLPPAHSFAQVLKAVWYRLGITSAFASIDTLVEDLAAVQPTTMPSVPRVFEKIYTKIVSTGAATPGVRGRLFRWAMSHFDLYVEARKAGRIYDVPGWRLARRLVFKKIAGRMQEIFGPRMRYFISGGAPLAPKIAWFFELCGYEILEGYGLTETAAGGTLNRPGATRIGTVGPPQPGIEVKIAGDGEILVRGPNVMKGYHGKPEATAEVLEPDGWFHTGDIGELDADGYLRITDRKKNIIVTAGGKNIAPQNLENRLKTHALISQVMVHGDKRKFLSALITLDEEALEGFARDRGLSGDYAALTRDPRVRAEIQAAVDQLNTEVARFETLKTFAILETDFSPETGELTPTLKVKRRIVEERYAELLDGFYDEKY